MTDEGAGKQQLTGNYPSSGAARHLPPQGVKAFVPPGKAAIIDSYGSVLFSVYTARPGVLY